MFQGRCIAIPFAALTMLLATLVLSRSARADIILAVADPAHYGLVAFDPSNPNLWNFAPATDNPTRVFGDGGRSRSSMSQNGTMIAIGLEVIEGGTSTTGAGPQNPSMFDIPVQILGTNGEPAGTPVTLRLESNIGGASPANAQADLRVNTTFYLPSQVYLIEGFKTGDTFRYWAGLHGGFQTAANFLSVLSVQAAGLGEPTPQPDKQVTITSPDEGSTHPTAPVRLQVQLGHGAPVWAFRAFLNRREVTGKFVPERQGHCNPGHCQLVAAVFPEDGLQRGRNSLHVEVRKRNGALAKATSTFFVNGPTARAGADVRGKVGQTVWLDGSQSLGTFPLRHQWVLLHKPEGSNVTLSDPSTAKPSFIPDVNGSYVARLVVHDGHFRSEPDTVTVGASSASFLVPAKTRLCCGQNNGYSIKIGDKEYNSDPAANSAGLQILALSAATLAATAQGTFATGPGSSFDPIKNFLNARQSGEIVILSSTQTSGTHNAELGALLAGDGKTPAFGANSEIGALPDSVPYTFVGVKGYKYDQAFQYGNPDPNYTGYFLQDATGSYKYFQRDFVKFQIKDPARPNTITVGKNVYTAPPLQPSDAIGGFHLVILDRFTLTPLLDENGQPFNRSYATGSTAGANEAERMAADLNKVANVVTEAALFLISSLGRPAFYQPDSALFEVSNSNATTNHGNITLDCVGRTHAAASSGWFRIGHFADFFASVSCPGNFPSFNTWSWTHTGSGDHAQLLANELQRLGQSRSRDFRR
jgi:hypothetical protein